MTVAWTTKVEELGLAIVPLQYRTKAKELFAEAGKKRNGYVTIKMTLPERVGTDQQNRNRELRKSTSICKQLWYNYL